MVLVHICCADCGIKLIDALKKEQNIHDQDIVLYFYNPNIHPESEWHARKNAIQKIFDNSMLKLHIVSWEPKNYFEAINKEAERVKDFDVNQKKYRCPLCWELRLRNTIEYAQKNNFEYISSTLFSSIYHDTKLITKIAQKLEKEYKLKIIIPKNIDHCHKTNGFYKQNYEGCVYSLVEKMTEKYLLKK
jgi:epoxyqueuosine reductase